MDAIILAGGFGSRLERLIGGKIPKPLLEINGKTLLEYNLDLAASAGINRAVISVSHRREQIIERFGKGPYRGMTLDYVVDDPPQGDAGAFRDAYRLVEGRSLLLNADEIRNGLDLRAMITEHERSGRLATVAVIDVDDPYQHGIFEMDPRGLASSFIMNPADRSLGLANTGCYIVEKSILSHITEGYQMMKSVIPAMVSNGVIGCYQFKGTYYNVGTEDVVARVLTESLAW